MVDFNDEAFDHAVAACKRWEKIYDTTRDLPSTPYGTRQSRVMDLCAADGKNGNAPLDWKAIAEADAFDFIHDIGGIHKHMDRRTGQIGGGFLPRMTLKERV